MDPLSDVLALLKPRSYMSGGFDMGGDWSLQFPQHAGTKCYALVGGRCWLRVDGVAEAALIEAGDCFLLPTGRPFVLTSDRALVPIDAHAVFGFPLNGRIRTVGGGGNCFGVGGHFILSGPHVDMLMGALPPIVHLRSASDKAALRWAIERMMEELREPRPGSLLMAQHLAHMMLVQALRLHLSQGPSGGVGWLFALADRHMGQAIGAMHEAPGRRWTLQELARHVGMSRTVFAERFKRTVGTSPMDYLIRWRMMLAGDRLMHSDESVAVIAQALCYESEAAFGTAFKRVMGCSPRQYGRAVPALSAVTGERLQVL